MSDESVGSCPSEVSGVESDEGVAVSVEVFPPSISDISTSGTGVRSAEDSALSEVPSRMSGLSVVASAGSTDSGVSSGVKVGDGFFRWGWTGSTAGTASGGLPAGMFDWAMVPAGVAVAVITPVAEGVPGAGKTVGVGPGLFAAGLVWDDW